MLPPPIPHRPEPGFEGAPGPGRTRGLFGDVGYFYLSGSRHAAALQAVAGQVRDVESLLEPLRVEVGTRLARVVTVELNLARLGARFEASDSRLGYWDFVRGLGDGGLRQYVERKYPALVSSVDARIDRFFAAVASCLAAFRHDADLLLDERSPLIDTPSEAREVHTVRLVGDPHRQGSAAIIELFHGERVVYKPRPGRSELFYEELLHLVDPDLEQRLTLPAVLDRDGYHWQRFVESREPAADDEAHGYAYGAWLSLAYHTGLVDLHFENVIVGPGGPCPVDLECGPCVPVVKGPGSRPLDSPEEVGILPFVVGRRTGFAGVRWGAIGAQPDVPPFPLHVVHDGETTGLSLVEAPQPEPDRATAVPVSARALRRGYRDASRALARHRDQIILMLDDEVRRPRVLLRATQEYADLLRRASFPRYARSVAATRQMFRRQLRATVPWLPDAAIENEVDCLLKAEIPRYEAFSDAQTMQVGTGRVELLAGLDRVRQRLASADDEACLRFAERVSSQQLLVAFDAAGETEQSTGAHDAVPRDVPRVVGAAAETIWRARRPHEAVPTWSNIAEEKGRGFRRVESFGDLYSGTPGTLLALAASSGSGGGRLGEALRQSCRRIGEELARTPDTSSLGVYSGVSGWAYVLACVRSYEPTAWADEIDDVLRQILRHVARAVDPTIGHDVISGASGILALVARLRRAGFDDARLLDLLEWRCLEVLVDLRTSAPGLAATWIGPEGVSLGGFGHGVAGVAWATSLSTDPDAREISRQAWEAQTALFDPSTGRWSDLRPIASATDARLEAWCHGADGILLASLYGNGLELPDALQCDPGWTRGWLDSLRYGDASLCHGSAGRLAVVQLLLRAAEGSCCARLDRAALEDERARLSAHVARELSTSIHTRTFLGLNDGLMMGRGGLVIALLLGESPGGSANPLLLGLPDERGATGGRATAAPCRGAQAAGDLGTDGR